jgi:hypothetical protein
VCDSRFYVESWSASCHWCNNIEFEFELGSFHLSFTGNWNVERTQNDFRTSHAHCEVGVLGGMSRGWKVRNKTTEQQGTDFYGTREVYSIGTFSGPSLVTSSDTAVEKLSQGHRVVIRKTRYPIVNKNQLQIT